MNVQPCSEKQQCFVRDCDVLVVEIALVHQCLLAGELTWIQRRGRQQERRLLRECQTAVGSPRVQGTFYDVESCVTPLHDPRTPPGARCDVEIVDGSHH